MANGSGLANNSKPAKGMRVAHLSYAHIIDYSDPEKWLKKINFFAALVEEMAKDTDVKSVHCIRYTGVMKRNDVEYHFLKCSKLEIMFPFKLHRYILNHLKPDVIIVHGIHFPLQVILLHRSIRSAKIIIQHHSERPLRHIKGILQRIVDRFTSAYFFPSIEQAKPWVEQGQIESTAKVHEVIEVPSVFYPIDKKEAKAVTKIRGSKVYIWVGRFDENKDPLTLVKGFIEFARSVNDTYLYVIYQSNELEEEVRSIINKAEGLSDRIVLVGKIEHDDLLYWYNSADFIVSTSHYEGMGVAVCEGMSCGCIPVLSDIPSFRAMTADETCGVLFTPGNVGDLKTKLMYSGSLDISIEREKVLARYESTMSAGAISRKMISVCQSVLSKR